MNHPFDEVEPRRAGGDEVESEAGVAVEPGPHVGVLVGAVVVDDEVDSLGLVDGAVDMA